MTDMTGFTIVFWSTFLLLGACAAAVVWGVARLIDRLRG